MSGITTINPPCPRCGAYGIRDADAYWCLACGTYGERRFRAPWDIPADARPNRPSVFRPWSPAEDAYLIRHLHTTPVEEIAAALGRTRRAVYSRLTYKGWYRRPRRAGQREGVAT